MHRLLLHYSQPHSVSAPISIIPPRPSTIIGLMIIIIMIINSNSRSIGRLQTTVIDRTTKYKLEEIKNPLTIKSFIYVQSPIPPFDWISPPVPLLLPLPVKAFSSCSLHCSLTSPYIIAHSPDVSTPLATVCILRNCASRIVSFSSYKISGSGVAGLDLL